MSQDTCNFCEGLSVQTPEAIYNRSGLKEISYRVGTYTTFKQSLLARLSLADHPALKRLTTRADDDFTIAWLDAFSIVADVLTFYQERIVNESYLPTATERFSVLQLARLIGYELRPGVAATTYIAFTLDDSPGALGPVLPANKLINHLVNLPPITLEKGIRIQSIPAPDEKAQTYETVETIEARVEWNTIKPRTRQPQIPLNDDLILLENTNNNLKKGDLLLIRKPDAPSVLKIILNTIINEEAKTTRVESASSPSLPVYNQPVWQYAVFTQFLTPMAMTQTSVNLLSNKTWKEADLSALVTMKKWSPADLVMSINTPAPSQPSPTDPEVYVFRKNAQIFGYNAPRKVTYNDNGTPKDQSLWAEWDIDEKKDTLFLDSKYEEILPGSQIAIKNAGKETYYKVDKVNITARTKYGISTKTTQITLIPNDKEWWGTGTTLDAIRSATIYIQSERLQLAQLPIEDIVTGDQLTLDRYYPGLKENQSLVVSGECSDLFGVAKSELVTLKAVNVVQGFTVLGFKQSLTYNYIRKSVTINANVAMATHGETTEEILGSGNAASIFQQFTLKQPPLTYITAATNNGVQSSLEIRVDNLLWKEVDYFLDHGPHERIYITRRDNDGYTTVTFGDGINGARLPTGQQNIKAKYRKGIGTGGLVKANQLSQLITKPLGVKSAVNPVLPGGAEDAEQLDAARNNACLTIRALDRVVSLQDYEDFAQAFAGIDKAMAAWTWYAGKRQVLITIAGSNGQEIKKTEDLYTKLLTAINTSGNPKVSVWMEPYTAKFFRLSAGIVIHPDYLSQLVLAAVEQNLRDAFSFQARSFAQPVTYSEVVACIQKTVGVIAVDIDALYLTADNVESIQYFMNAAMPVVNNGHLFAAELLTLDPRPITLKIIQ